MRVKCRGCGWKRHLSDATATDGQAVRARCNPESKFREFAVLSGGRS